jgi:type IV pilus assembly protein PilY1
LQTNGVVKENSGTQTYAQFMTSTQTRLNVVYSGANDGLLHGFRAGAYKSDGKFDKSLNDGKEVLAYMPSAVLRTIHDLNDATLDYSSTKYGHNFFVDATPGTDDLFYGGTWHTWLVGGLGAGGGAIYALEVTDPSATNFTEGNAASIVIGEWGAGTETKAGAIKCTNVTDCGTNLGNTYGVPVIRRLHNGAWAAIFGNGFHSTTGDAGIYIMSVDPTSGTKTFYYLSANKTGANGIANVAPADLDGDHITDYVYAGDLLGNVWRFDLTDTDPTKWKVTSSPVFSTGGQPITTKLVLAVLPPATALGPQRLMVDFGTGQKIPPTTTTPVSFANGTQTLYGIWDWNMGSWNALSGQKYASLTGTQSIVASG